jgi:hypothetical protein
MVKVYFFVGVLVIILAVIHLKSPNWVTVITVVGFLGIHCGFVLELYIKYCDLADEGNRGKFQKLCIEVLNITTVVFTLMYTVFMPKWYIPLLFSTLTCTISRSLLVVNSDGRTAAEMAAPVVFGIGVAILFSGLAYNFRWHLIRSFVI